MCMMMVWCSLFLARCIICSVCCVIVPCCALRVVVVLSLWMLLLVSALRGHDYSAFGLGLFSCGLLLCARVD